MTLRNLPLPDLTFTLIFATALLMPGSTGAQNGNYTFTNIDYPGAVLTSPGGINDSANVVGYYFRADGVVHSFLKYSAGLVSFDYPGASATGAAGINNSSLMTGYYNDAGGTHGFLLNGGTFSSFDCPLGGGQTNPHGINNHGVVVGTCYNGSGPSGFIDDHGSFSFLGYPGACSTVLYGINDDGDIVGTYRSDCSGDTRGFLYSGGTFTALDYPGATNTYTIGINNSGVVVGYSSEGAFTWHAGQFTQIQSTANPAAYSINNNGQIVGIYFPSGAHGFIATPTSQSALQFVPVAPCRLVDTRPPGGSGPIQAGTFESFTVPQLGGCNIPSNASAYSLNVTVVPPGRLGFLTIWPTGQPRPEVSLMNSLDGRIKANAAIVPAGAGGAVNVYVNNTSNVLLDIDGYFAPPNPQSLQFYPLTPCRVVDTRNANGPLAGPVLRANHERDFPIPESSCIPANANPIAYSFNVTAVPNPTGQRLGFLTVWPKGLPQPGVSTLNNLTGTIVANAAIVPAGLDGSVAVYPNNTTDLLIDINGYFAAPGTGLSLYTVTPCRALDTRGPNGNLPPFIDELPVNVHGSPCAPPLSAQAYVLNATVVPPASLGFLTLWPNGEPRPDASTLNAKDGAITSNMAIVPTSNGFIDAYANALTQLLLDISSYFAP